MTFDRGAGILLPIFSLKSKYGIGTFGKEAYKFVDFLEKAKQKYWQILPLGPTGYGDSPYQSFSSFAGNPYFIDLEFLIEDGDLALEFVEEIKWFDKENLINYEYIYIGRSKVLRKVFETSYNKYKDEVLNFEKENRYWIYDYAFYMALKSYFDMKAYLDFDDEALVLKDEERISHYKELLKDEISYHIFIQYLFYKQWMNLKTYANNKGISIIGDIPIYVSLDSSDFFSNTKLFLVDEKNVPTFIAGVPPDYFSESGQLWGNPLYAWDKMKEDKYEFWKKRILISSKLYDVLRIDHFRAFESFYKIKNGEETAKNGTWEKGPGLEFIKELQREFVDFKFIAEDLGDLNKEVRDMLDASNLPGMKVLSFAFDSSSDNIYLPHFHKKNSVCYVGTHDNDTLRSFIENADKKVIDFIKEYFDADDEKELVKKIILAGMSSVSNIFIAQIQDYLNLGTEGRINTPGTSMGNWCFRLDKDLSDELANKLARYCEIYSR